MDNEIKKMDVSINKKIETFNLNTKVDEFKRFVNDHRPCTIKYAGVSAIVLYDQASLCCRKRCPCLCKE